MPLEPTEAFPAKDFFANLSVHQDMIYDTVRVSCYERAIRENMRFGDVVLDIGTGTGLLAIMCARMGASRVHAIESSSIIEAAQEVIQLSGFADRIFLHRGLSTEIDLKERVDLVVTETIGHLGFEEGIFDILDDARKRFIKADGYMIPENLRLIGAPVRRYDFPPSSFLVDRVKREMGFDISLLRRVGAGNVYIRRILPEDLLSLPETIFTADFYQGLFNKNQKRFVFEIKWDGVVTGMGLWFESDLSKGVSLVTSPMNDRTHWQQCFAPFIEPVEVKRGKSLHLKVEDKFDNGTLEGLRFRVDRVV